MTVEKRAGERLDRELGHAHADPLGDELGAVEIRAGKEQRELLAAVAGGRVDVADGLLEHLGECPQDVVPGQVAVAVVDALEVVQVGDHERERAAVALHARELLREAVLELAAVRQLGEPVGGGLELEPRVRARVVERRARLRGEPVGELAGLVREVGADGREQQHARLVALARERDLERLAARRREFRCVRSRPRPPCRTSAGGAGRLDDATRG